MSAIGASLLWSFWFAGLMNTGPSDRMYDCLPMYHSVGGVVAIGAASGARRLGGDPRQVLGAAISGTISSTATARSFNISASSCRYLRRRAPHPARARASAAALRAATGCAPTSGRAFQETLRHSAHPRVLRGDRGQCSRSTMSRASSARSAAFPPFLRASLSAGAGQIRRRRTASRCAANDGLLHPLRRRRSRRGDRPHP